MKNLKFLFVFLLMSTSPPQGKIVNEAFDKPADKAKLGEKITAPVIQPSAEDVDFIKKIDMSYQKAKTLSMDIKKSLKTELLDSNTSASGRVMFSKGKMRMEMDPPDKSLVVIDKKNIWVVNYPSAEFKDSALQIIKADASSKKGRSQNFLSLLTQGGILKFFNVSGLQKVSEEERVFFLQPNEATVEFKRAQIVINPKTSRITSLKYWDEIGNETIFEFSNIHFDTKLAKNAFSYTPPAKADITTF